MIDQKAKITQQAQVLHQNSIIIDGHCDTILDTLGLSETDKTMGSRDIAVRSNQGHVDIPRLMDAGVTAQFFALFTSDEHMGDPTAHTWRLLRAAQRISESSPHLIPATTSADILSAKEQGKIAAFLAIEGGEAIGTSLETLKEFYQEGVRLMTLTWNRRNAIGRGVGTKGDDGLSDFGRTVIGEMERLGMIVDVSHLSDVGLDDVLAIATRPLVASHSNSRQVYPHRRNLTDEQIAAIAATGGLIGLTLVGVFLDSDPKRVTMDRLMEHLDRMVDAAGVDHIGLGTDFDGFTAPYGLVMEDCTGLPGITEAMLRRGYRDEDAAKIMGGNWLRVIREVVG